MYVYLEFTYEKRLVGLESLGTYRSFFLEFPSDGNSRISDRSLKKINLDIEIRGSYAWTKHGRGSTHIFCKKVRCC